MNSDGFSNGSNTVTISYELLCLLRWLTEHDEDKLKKIITKAFASGLHHDLRKLDNNQDDASLEATMQHSIIDFLSLLESLLLKVIGEQTNKKAKIQKLLPAIDKIDTSICDDTTVRFSLEKTTAKMDSNPDENAKDMLYKELLKRWKPHNKNKMN